MSRPAPARCKSMCTLGQILIFFFFEKFLPGGLEPGSTQRMCVLVSDTTLIIEVRVSEDQSSAPDYTT